MRSQPISRAGTTAAPFADPRGRSANASTRTTAPRLSNTKVA